MAKDNAELSQKLAIQGARMTPLAFEKNILTWFSANGRRLSTFAGSEGEAKKFLAALFYTASRNPALTQCDIMSLGDCLMQSAQLKLYPGPTNECAYVPFGGKAQFMPMYQGLIKLCYNTGLIKDIQARVVYSGDEFSYELGSEPLIKHKPFLGKESDRGERIAVYAAIRTIQGIQIEVKSMDWVESLRLRSPAGKNPERNSPWKTDYDEMACAKILKYALKKIPKTPELAQAIEIDNAIDRPEDSKEEVLKFDTKLDEIEISKEEKAIEEINI